MPNSPLSDCKEEIMIFKIIALGLVVMLIVANYAMLIVAHKADEQAERMYKLWEEQRKNDRCR